MRKTFLAVLFLLTPLCLAAQCSSAPPQTGIYPGSNGPAQYVVVMPQPATCYNGNMILFAHGYVPQGAPSNTWLSQLALPDGTSLPALVNSLGFGFAASSFSKDGLAILQGIQDTKSLENVVHGLSIPVNRYILTGASEGGLITAKSIENDPSYTGGLAVCGPVGSFTKQVDYFGDARVLFDYFFPGVLSSAGGSAVDIPAILQANWVSVYEPAVRQAVNSNPLATLQLLSTANIAIGLSFSNAADAITGVLWYNVFATNDAHVTLGGNPYDNIGRRYSGSFNDTRLNASVARFHADTPALLEMQKYETSGLLYNPLVTLHTLADPIVPYTQEPLYKTKVQAAHATSELAQIPALSYGHCNVSSASAKAALLVLLLKTGL